MRARVGSSGSRSSRHRRTTASTAGPRRVVLALTAVLSVVALTGCDQHTLGTDQAPITLTESTVFVPDSGSAGSVQSSLTSAIADLRTATKTPWVGRQDDVTGYLAELSGGSYAPATGGDLTAVVNGFMAAYGRDLFGIGSEDLKLGPAMPPISVGGGSIVKADQVYDGIPVLDASLIFTVGAADTAARLNSVRGRVYPDLKVDSTPKLPAAKAQLIAKRLSQGRVVGPTTLVVLPDDGGRLAWQLTVVGITSSQGSSGGLSEGVYFIDARNGQLLQLRQADADVSTLVPAEWNRIRGQHVTVRPVTSALAAPTVGAPVQISGSGPLGQPLKAVGSKTGGGVLLDDTTLPWYDAATDTGGIKTYTMAGSKDEGKLPGTLDVLPAGTPPDPDALAAQSYSADILDYYASLGRTSYDNTGTTLVSSVHFNDGTFCNAFFTQALKQMVYGNPCTGPNGDAQMVSLDVAAHEVTHGVTGSSAKLIYHGQSGAMNESFSDYFGNVISNKVTGEDNSTIGEDLCSQVTSPEPPLCTMATSDGTLALRQMLNGNTVDDYIKLLEPGPRLATLGAVDQDSGGVHTNSSIWNNALWSIRTDLAQIDGMPGNDSPLAQDFDKIVYYTLTTQLQPSAGFIDGRMAIEQVTKDAGADPVILRTEDQVFDQNLICAGCPQTQGTPGMGVDETPETQLDPTVHGDQVAWIDVGNEGFAGQAETEAADAGIDPTMVHANALQVVFAGDALVTLGGDGSVVRSTSDGTSTVLDKVDPNEAIARGLGGSDDGAAWYDLANDQVKYVDATGKVSKVSLAPLPKTILSLSSGGGQVAMGTADGLVVTWKPGGKLQQVGSMPAAILSIGSYGSNVIATDSKGDVAVFGPNGTVQLGANSYPFGAAVNSDYAVWSQIVGDLPDGSAPDTDLYLYSFKTGMVYDIINSSGQQGFPAISGSRLVWQDAVNGGDDILTASLPSGL